MRRENGSEPACRGPQLTAGATGGSEIIDAGGEEEIPELGVTVGFTLLDAGCYSAQSSHDLIRNKVVQKITQCPTCRAPRAQGDFQDDAVVDRPPPPQSSFLLPQPMVSFLTCPKVSEGLARPGGGVPADPPRKGESASERLAHFLQCPWAGSGCCTCALWAEASVSQFPSLFLRGALPK